MAQKKSTAGSSPDPRRTFLFAYISVQEAADKRIDALLRQARDDAEREIERLAGKEGVGAKVRSAQLVGSRGAITRILERLFALLRDTIRESQKEASLAAAEANIKWERDLLRIIEPDAARRSSLEEALRQTAERSVQSMITRVLKTDMPLSKRVYGTQRNTIAKVKAIVNNSIARGDSANDIAKKVREHISPSTPGGVNFAAKRLARTEINNAFHAQSIHDAQDRPWVREMTWHLSKTHTPRPGDACELYARRGRFPIDAVPAKPHPQCMCFVTANQPPMEVFAADVANGRYDDWLRHKLDSV